MVLGYLMFKKDPFAVKGSPNSGPRHYPTALLSSRPPLEPSRPVHGHERGERLLMAPKNEGPPTFKN
jgi:hypothetical protein